MKCTTDALVSLTATWYVTEEAILVVFHFSIFTKFRFFLFFIRFAFVIQCKRKHRRLELFDVVEFSKANEHGHRIAQFIQSTKDCEERERKKINLERCDTKRKHQVWGSSRNECRSNCDGSEEMCRKELNEDCKNREKCGFSAWHSVGYVLQPINVDFVLCRLTSCTSYPHMCLMYCVSDLSRCEPHNCHH